VGSPALPAATDDPYPSSAEGEAEVSLRWR
jgi:hypothetical protein